MTESSAEVKKAIEKAYVAFTEAVINDLHVNFHPDNDFRGYIDGNDEASFGYTDARNLEDLNRAFNKILGNDVYDLGLPILRKAIARDEPVRRKGLYGE